jgi:hypothetical protein
MGEITFPLKALHGIYLTRHGPSTLYRARHCRARARGQREEWLPPPAAAGARDRDQSASIGISSGSPHNCMHAHSATARRTERSSPTRRRRGIGGEAGRRGYTATQ